VPTHVAMITTAECLNSLHIFVVLGVNRFDDTPLRLPKRDSTVWRGPCATCTHDRKGLAAPQLLQTRSWLHQ
jgi:hypothetical protein